MFEAGASTTYLDALNPEQRAAATHPGGPLLVLAGAGTGKTTTLCARVAWLVDQGVRPSADPAPDLHAARSAGDARRAPHSGARRGAGTPGAWSAAPSTRSPTASCVATLRRSASPPASACSTRATPPTCSTSCARSAGVGETGRRFPRKRRCWTSTRGRSTPSDRCASCWPSRSRGASEHVDELARLFATTARASARSARSTSTTCCSTGARCAQDAVVGAQLGAAIDHVLVDEYQDVNALQVEIVRGLRASTTNVTVVGDDLQAIYGFRSASARAHPRLPRALPGRDGGHPRAQLPLHAAAARRRERGRRAGRRARFSQGLRAEREGGDGPSSCSASTRRRRRARSASACSPRASAALPLREQAVLMRAGHDSDLLELELARREIPSSSTAGCATSRPRTSRTSSPCCAWPTTRPTRLAGSACCSCSRASGRRAPGARSRRSSPTPAAWPTCSRAGRRRGALPATARGPADARRRRAGRRRRRARGRACAPSGCATRWPRSSRRTTPTAPCACSTSTRSWRPPGRRPTSHASSPSSSSTRRPRARTWPGPAARRGLARALDRALGEGPRVAIRPRARALRRQLPLRHGAPATARRSRRSGGCSTSR